MNKKRKKNHGKSDEDVCIKKTDIDYSNLEDISFSEIDSKLNLNEPTYCFCKYISFGNMIKCDNDKVSYLLSLFLCLCFLELIFLL